MNPIQFQPSLATRNVRFGVQTRADLDFRYAHIPATPGKRVFTPVEILQQQVDAERKKGKTVSPQELMKLNDILVPSQIGLNNVKLPPVTLADFLHLLLESEAKHMNTTSQALLDDEELYFKQKVERMDVTKPTTPPGFSLYGLSKLFHGADYEPPTGRCWSDAIPMNHGLFLHARNSTVTFDRPNSLWYLIPTGNGDRGQLSSYGYCVLKQYLNPAVSPELSYSVSENRLIEKKPNPTVFQRALQSITSILQRGMGKGQE